MDIDLWFFVCFVILFISQLLVGSIIVLKLVCIIHTYTFHNINCNQFSATCMALHAVWHEAKKLVNSYMVSVRSFCCFVHASLVIGHVAWEQGHTNYVHAWLKICICKHTNNTVLMTSLSEPYKSKLRYPHTTWRIAKCTLNLGVDITSISVCTGT